MSSDQPRAAELAEMDRLREEVAKLAGDVAGLVAELQQLRDALALFEAAYAKRIAPLMARAEYLEAATAVARGDSAEAARAGMEAAERVATSAPTDVYDQREVDLEGRDQLKDQYRRLARLAHPDLATSPGDRTRRHSLMARVNEAWRAADAAELALVEAELEDVESPTDPRDVGAVLVKLLRSRRALAEREVQLTSELDGLRQSSLNSLRLRAEHLALEDRDVLEEMATELRERIAVLETHRRCGGVKGQ